jgi:hypothetical protein
MLTVKSVLLHYFPSILQLKPSQSASRLPLWSPLVRDKRLAKITNRPGGATIIQHTSNPECGNRPSLDPEKAPSLPGESRYHIPLWNANLPISEPESCLVRESATPRGLLTGEPKRANAAVYARRDKMV